MPSQVIIFYQPRSTCRVVMRMVLDKQPNVDLTQNLFSQARGLQVDWLRSEGHENGVSESAKQSIYEAIQNDIQAWQYQLRQAREKQQLFVLQTYPFSAVMPERVLEYMRKVTSQGADTSFEAENMTEIPDSLLLTPDTIPVLVIRNPRLAIPSAFRVLRNMGITEGGGRSMALMTTCNVWSRVLYDFYVANNVEPLVLDADDFLTDHDFVRRVCERLCLDPDKAQFEWPAMTDEEKNKMHPMEFLSGEEFFHSTAPDARRAAPKMEEDLGQAKWNEQFGADAKLIEELVDFAMPHYEYLRQRRAH